MTSPATSRRHLSKFEKTAENVASSGFRSNFSGAAFRLAQPIGWLVVHVYLCADKVNESKTLPLGAILLLTLAHADGDHFVALTSTQIGNDFSFDISGKLCHTQDMIPFRGYALDYNICIALPDSCFVDLPIRRAVGDLLTVLVDDFDLVLVFSWRC